MSLPRHAWLSLAILAGALLSSALVWTNARVDLGLRLEERAGRVYVADVTPDGIAGQHYVMPGSQVLQLWTTDGRNLPTGAAIPWPDSEDGLLHPPKNAVEEQAIDSIWVGFEEGGYEGANMYAVTNQLRRADWEWRLTDSIWAVLTGLLSGAAVWVALHLGAAGPLGRREAVPLGVATALPFVMLPAVYAGTAQGIAAGYLVPALGALVVGLGIARQHPDPAWRRISLAAALVATGVTIIVVGQHMSQTVLGSGESAQIIPLIIAIALIPAATVGLANAGWGDRASHLSLGFIPGVAAVTVLGTQWNVGAAVLVGGLIGCQLLPLGRLGGVASRFRGWTGGDAPSASPVAPVADDPATRERRDVVAFLIAGAAVLMSASRADTLPLLVGLGSAVLAGYALRGGFLGAAWTSFAVPVGVAVGVPIMFATYELPTSTVILLATIAALVVAHALAWRHPDEAWRYRHFAAAVVVAAFAIIEGSQDWGRGALVVSSLVPLIPGISLAFGTRAPGDGTMTGRLETLAVALTPGVAMATMVTGPGVALLIGWFVALVVWRRFTLAPLVGFAQRTQQQLDLAVAAAEQERARLAADLHDDALQELTGLVRRLDEAGDAEGAEMARGIATRLRGITSDLRLPLLDDLGAGPALEWLVARVRPMAGGEVRLERADPSRPPSAVELAVFRVAQEALANAVKHGKAPITVRYHVDEAGHVSLTVDDAGPGIDPRAAEAALADGHLGVANMQQRAEQIGALLNIRAWPTGGTHVGLEWRPQ
jgi:signal transduction histidine kinase